MKIAPSQLFSLMVLLIVLRANAVLSRDGASDGGDLSYSHGPLDAGDEAMMFALRDALGSWPVFSGSASRDGANSESDDPCTWYGVECLDHRVISILLDFSDPSSSSFVDGRDAELESHVFKTLPPDFFLPSLQSFSIECSPTLSLEGELPMAFVTGQMVNLTDLTFHRCVKLQSDISQWRLGNTSLTTITLRGNMISGDITGFECARQTAFMDLSSNLITGTFPWQCYRGSFDSRHQGLSLQINLAWNRLTDLGSSLDQEMCIPVVAPGSGAQLFLQGNDMKGNLANIENAFSCFTYIELFDNQLSGSLPASIWETAFLDLRYNNFSGQIPSPDFTQRAPDVEYHMYLANNCFTGSVPALPASWTVFSLDVSFNKLTGFPSQFNASKYIHLGLSHNELTGELPWPSNAMEYLDVSHNQLTGCPLAPVFQYNAPKHIGPCDYPVPNSLSMQEAHLNDNKFECPQCAPVWACSDYCKPESRLSLDLLDISNNNFSGLEMWEFNVIKLTARNASLSGKLRLGSLIFGDVSCNNLTGYLPILIGFPLYSSTLFSDYYLISSEVISLNLSYNNFVGGLNTHFGFYSSAMKGSTLSDADITYVQPGAWALEELDIRGNPASITEGTAHLIPTTIVVFASDDYTCPTLTVAGSSTTVYASPDFYEYAFCQCDNQFFGGPVQGGYNCTALATLCGDLTCLDLTATTSIDVVANPAYFAIPTFNETTSFVACQAIQPSMHTYACAGQCLCKAQAGSLDCNCSSLCAEGYEGTLCSRCEDGFFAVGLLCLHCETNNNMLSIVIGSVAVLLSIIALIATVRKEDAPTPVLTGRCVALRQNKIVVGVIVVEVVILGVSVALFNVANLGIIGVCVFLSLLLQLAWVQSSGVEPVAPDAAPGFLASKINVNAINILLTFLQTTAACVPSGFFTFESHAASITPISSPPPLSVYGATAARTVAQVSPYGLECYINGLFSVEASFYASLLIPVGLMVILAFVALIVRCRFRSKDGAATAAKTRDRAYVSVIFLINYLVFNAVVAIVQIFNCDHIGSSSEYHVLNYPWIQCFGTTWLKLVAVGGGVLFGYALALLAIVLYMRRTIHVRGLAAMGARFAFLVAPFKAEYWYFGIIVIIRRILVGVGLSAFPSESLVGPLTVLTALIVGQVAQTTSWPYEASALNWIETAGLVILSVTYTAVVLLNLGMVVFSNEARIALLASNAIFLLCAVIYILSPSLRKLRSKRSRTINETSDAPEESKPLIDHWTDAKSRLVSDPDSTRVHDLEQEIAVLRQRNAKLESDLNLATLRASQHEV